MQVTYGLCCQPFVNSTLHLHRTLIRCNKKIKPRKRRTTGLAFDLKTPTLQNAFLTRRIFGVILPKWAHRTYSAQDGFLGSWSCISQDSAWVLWTKAGCEPFQGAVVIALKWIGVEMIKHVLFFHIAAVPYSILLPCDLRPCHLICESCFSGRFLWKPSSVSMYWCPIIACVSPAIHSFAHFTEINEHSLCANKRQLIQKLHNGLLSMAFI